MATIAVGQFGQEASPVSAAELQQALYAACASQPLDKAFSQQDLQDLNVIPNNDLNQLHACAQALTKERLFKLFTKDGIPCWKVVKKEDAAK